MDKLQNELSELWYKISTEKKLKMEHIKTLQSQIETMGAMMDEIEDLLKRNGCHRVFARWEENKPCVEAADKLANNSPKVTKENVEF